MQRTKVPYLHALAGCARAPPAGGGLLPISPRRWEAQRGSAADRAAMSLSLVDEALPVVHQVVASMRRRLPRSIERDELVAAGMLGLAQAAQAYDPTRGVSFTA